MKLSDRVTTAPEVMAKQLEGETVLLDLAGGMYYGLNPVGSRIWELLDAGTGRLLSEVCDVMLREFEVTRDELEADVLRICDELRSRGLLELAKEPSGAT